MKTIFFASLISFSAIADTISVQNESITINLRFNEFQGLDKQRYVDAAKEWLEVVKSVEGREHHTLDIDIVVTDTIESDGLALVEESVPIGGLEIPTYGVIWMHANTHQPNFEVASYKGTILHEIGHILGIGSTTDPFIVDHIDEINGSGFCKDNSVALATYNRLYNTQFTCLPFSTNGHLYDDIQSEDEPRGNHVPPMTQEVMANGNDIRPITLAVLDDIGYQVDYTQIDMTRK